MVENEFIYVCGFIVMHVMNMLMYECCVCEMNLFLTVYFIVAFAHAFRSS